MPDGAAPGPAAPDPPGQAVPEVPGRQEARCVLFRASGWLLLAVTVATAVLIQVIRLFTIGTLSPAGTGGTDVADTFKISDAIAHAWEQVAFVFGRNSGPDYLCIEPFAKAPSDIRFLILASNAVLGLAVLIFLIGMIRDRGRVLAHGRNLVLFLAFIALCIGSSSVTSGWKCAGYMWSMRRPCWCWLI